jgi:hypothetical protein
MSGTIYKLQDGATATDADPTAQHIIGRHRVFQIEITNTATVVLEAKIPGTTTWVTLRTATASEGVSTAEPWPLVRARISAYTSGSVNVFCYAEE